MGKLIFTDFRKDETVVRDASSPNGVRLTHLYHVVRVWRITMQSYTYSTQRRYIIHHFGWNDTRERDADRDPSFDWESITESGVNEARAIRRAIKELDSRASAFAMAYEDMSNHPAYRDVAPAPLAVMEPTA